MWPLHWRLIVAFVVAVVVVFVSRIVGWANCCSGIVAAAVDNADADGCCCCC